jgi:hypothetical protein
MESLCYASYSQETLQLLWDVEHMILISLLWHTRPKETVDHPLDGSQRAKAKSPAPWGIISISTLSSLLCRREKWERWEDLVRNRLQKMAVVATYSGDSCQARSLLGIMTLVNLMLTS